MRSLKFLFVLGLVSFSLVCAYVVKIDNLSEHTCHFQLLLDPDSNFKEATYGIFDIINVPPGTRGKVVDVPDEYMVIPVADEGEPDEESNVDLILRVEPKSPDAQNILFERNGILKKKERVDFPSEWGSEVHHYGFKIPEIHITVTKDKKIKVDIQ